MHPNSGNPLRTLVVIVVLFGTLSGAAAGDDSAKKPDNLARDMAAAMQQQDWTNVIALGERVLAIDPQHPLALHDVGYAYHVEGKLDEALIYHKRCAELPKYRATACYNAGCAYALKGESDHAFEWLFEAAKAGFAQAALLDSDADLKSLAADPRLAKLKEQVAANGSRGDGRDDLMFASQNMQRAGTRVACFSNNGSPGQVAIEYGPIAWKDEYDSRLASGEFDSKRWRLGSDFFTNLDANVPFTLGSERFEPGEYYLLLERSPAGAATSEPRLGLWLVPAAEVRAAHLDAFWAHEVTGGRSLPLAHSSTGKNAETLAVELATQSESSSKGSLTIRFGPHVLETSFQIEIR